MVLCAIGNKGWLASRDSFSPFTYVDICSATFCQGGTHGRAACAVQSNPRLVISVSACCRTCGPSTDLWCTRLCVCALPSMYVQRNTCNNVSWVQSNQLTCGELTCGDVRVRTKPQCVIVACSSVSFRRFQGLELIAVMVLSCCYCSKTGCRPG